MAQFAQSLVRGKSLYEKTYDALRQAILMGELVSGERLIETQIAQQLRVSRTPIREAIRQLQKEKLVAADDHGWLRVATVPVTEAAHLYDCRIALETLAVTEACNRATPASLDRLRQLVNQACTLIKGQLPNDISTQLLKLDYDFHHLIAESSGNACLVALLEQVFNQMNLLRVQTTRHNFRVLEVCSEHQMIYAAIANQDVPAATQAIQKHLDASKVRVLKELEAFDLDELYGPT